MVSFCTARCMARMEAFRIFISSISWLSTSATAHASASFSIIGRRASRCSSVSCLESFSNGHSKFCGRITAAATTGPARQPRPASSQPHSRVKPEKFPFKPCWSSVELASGCFLMRFLAIKNRIRY